MNNFIKTSDEGTRDLLLKAGFQLVHEDGKCWTFINDAKKKATFDRNKVAFSNNLAI